MHYSNSSSQEIPKSDNNNNNEADNKISYDFIDLGLSVNWATCNIGATSPEKEGYYFMWGDLTPHNINEYYLNSSENIYKEIKKPSWDDYLFCLEGSNRNPIMTKYSDDDTMYYDGKMRLDLEDDAAYIYCGNKCRMPSTKDFEELVSNCDISYIDNYKDNLPVFLFKSKINNNEIFFPLASLDNYHYGIISDDDDNRYLQYESTKLLTNQIWTFGVDSLLVDALLIEYNDYTNSVACNINNYYGHCYRYIPTQIRAVQEK